MGEWRSFCSTPVLRDPLTNAVVCPILRKHRCEICGATGNNSHTRSYCPMKPEGTHNMALLKSSLRNSTHRRRRK
ncbi:nanos homolog 2-like [Haemaphysalis longicornis]